MRPIKLTRDMINQPEKFLRWSDNIFKCLQGGLKLAEGGTLNNNNIYTSFNLDNGDGIMLRIGATTSALPIKWNSGSAQVTLSHGLQRIPMGFIITDLDANAVIFRVGSPTINNLVLQTTNTAANAAVYIF